MWKRVAPVLALYIMANSAFAQDHSSLLDQRKQGEIAPFDTVLAVARSAVGDNAILLDAQLLDDRSGNQIKVFFRKSGQVVAVTLDASSGDLIGVSNYRRPNLWQRLFSGGLQAQFRRNAQSQNVDQGSESNSPEGADKGNDAGDGKGSDAGNDKGNDSGNDKGNDSGDDKGKDSGSGGDKDSKDKDDGGKSGSSDSGGKEKGGS